MNKIDELISLVRRADFPEIEFARDQVTFSDLGALAAVYDSLETWDQKAALINLIQDHLDPRFRPLMLDFLKAPDSADDASSSDDVTQLTKAIALCHLDENLDDFMRYYNDRALLKARLQAYITPAAGTQIPLSAAKVSRKAAPQNSPWQIAGVMALIVGIGLLLITANNWYTLHKYRRDGVTVEARITGKSNQDDGTCVGVSFFDKDLFDGGELYLTEICDFVTNDIWEAARRDAHEDVAFLPEDPQHKVIFAAALDSDQSPGIVIGGGLTILGLLALIWDRRKNRRGK